MILAAVMFIARAQVMYYTWGGGSDLNLSENCNINSSSSNLSHSYGKN